MAKSQSILGRKRDSSKIRPSGEGPVDVSQKGYKRRDPMADQKLYPNGFGNAGDEAIYKKGGKVKKQKGGTVQVLDEKVVNGKKMYLVEGDTIKAQKGTKVKALPVYPTDPEGMAKYKAYKDSLTLYNQYPGQPTTPYGDNVGSKYLSPVDRKVVISNKIKPIGYRSEGKGVDYPVYKKPVQPYYIPKLQPDNTFIQLRYDEQGNEFGKEYGGPVRAQDGKVIQDDRGQWDHPGEVTKINSPNITMKGVPYPVLGVSDTGHQQLMMPGQDYSFYGKSVTEYPLHAEDGILTKIAHLFGFGGDDKPKQKVNPLPEYIDIQDNRKINPVTGKPIDPNRELKSGKYSSKIIKDIVDATKKLQYQHPYRAIATSLQESNLGKTDENLGHVIGTLPQMDLADAGYSESEIDSIMGVNPNYAAAINMVSNLKKKEAEAIRKGYKTPEYQLQFYNGMGKLTPATEKAYHNKTGRNTNQFYGVDVTKQALDLAKNPAYGKTVMSLIPILQQNPEIQKIVKGKAKGGKIKAKKGTNVEEYYGGELPEVTVTANRPKSAGDFFKRYIDKVGKEYSGSLEGSLFAAPLMTIAGLPQAAATYAMSKDSKLVPSEALKIDQKKNPIKAMAADMILDPANLVGAELLKEGQLAKTLKNLDPNEIKALQNVYKLNPWAFKVNQENWYRQVGKSAIDDAIKTKVVREVREEVSPRIWEEFQDQIKRLQGDDAILDHNERYKQQIIASRRPASPFFAKGELFYPMGRKPVVNKVTNKLSKNPSGKGSADYLIETALPNESFQPAYVKGMSLGVPEEIGTTAILKPNPDLRNLENFKLYKQDWLRGYKEIPKKAKGGTVKVLKEKTVNGKKQYLIDIKD